MNEALCYCDCLTAVPTYYAFAIGMQTMLCGFFFQVHPRTAIARSALREEERERGGQGARASR